MRRVATSLCLLGLAAVLTASPAAARTRPTAQVVVHHADGSTAHVRGTPRVQVVPTEVPAAEPTMGFDQRGRAFVNVVTRFQGQLWLPGVVAVTPDARRVVDVTPHRGQPEAHPFSHDPNLYADPTTGRVFASDLLLPCSALSYTDDGGETWADSTVGCTLADHQTVFAGPAPRGGETPTGYPNVVYYCAISDGALASYSFGTGCEKSLDGGATWSNTLGQPFQFDPIACPDGWYSSETSCDGVTGQGAVAPNGTVLIPKGFDGQPWLALSSDEGRSWRRVQVARNGILEDAYGYGDGQTSVAVDRRGTIYYGWTALDRQPYLSFSRDNGRTWHTPIRAGRPGLHQAWHTAIDVAGPGRVSVYYLGTENGPSLPFPDSRTCRGEDPVTAVRYVLEYNVLGGCDGADKYVRTSWNGYLTVSTDLLSRNPTFVTARLNPAEDPLTVGQCGPARCHAQYDFSDTHINPADGTAWAAYVDGCLKGSCSDIGVLKVARLVGVDLR